MTRAKAKIVVEAMMEKDPYTASLLNKALLLLYNRGLGYITVSDLQMVFISAFHDRKGSHLPDLP